MIDEYIDTLIGSVVTSKVEIFTVVESGAGDGEVNVGDNIVLTYPPTSAEYAHVSINGVTQHHFNMNKSERI